MTDLLDELDEAEHCRCGKTHEECAEDGGCKWSRCGDLLEAAWGVIANAGWDDCAKSPGWQGAAVRWRDSYHAWLRGEQP